MDNTLILVDYDNVFVTLKNNYRDFRKPNIMYDVITKIKEHYAGDNILSCRLFADFQKVQISDEGYDILKRNHVEIEHVFNGKNASDVILMINCMKYMLQYPHIDKIVLVSSDSDLVPIFHEVQLLNKKLEVMYFDINTSDDHKQHMKETNIEHHSIENLIGVSKYPECTNLEEFYIYKSNDIDYFAALLEKINNIITEEYDKFCKKDSSGKIINAGITKLSVLSEQAKVNALCPEREFRKNTEKVYNNLLFMLQEKKILVKYDYSLNGKAYNTLLLSEQYLKDKGITINGLIREKDFPSLPIDKPAEN